MALVLLIGATLLIRRFARALWPVQSEIGESPLGRRSGNRALLQMERSTRQRPFANLVLAFGKHAPQRYR
jgi:hypothetical protein